MNSAAQSKIKPVDWIVSAVLIIAGVIALYYAVEEQRLMQSSLKWPTSKGTVTRDASYWIELHNKGPSTARLDVVYSYQVAGKSYESHRIIHGINSVSNDPSAYLPLINGLTEGKTVTVHYDPAHPEYAVLHPEIFSNVSGFALFGFGGIIIGLAVIYSAWDKSTAYTRLSQAKK